MFILRQSTAVDVLVGPFVDGTDGATPEEALSPSVQLSKNGQTAATKNDVTTPAHDNAGMYNCEFDATDTDTVGTLVAFVEGAPGTHLQVRHEFQVVEEAVYDAFYAGSAVGIPSIPANWLTAAGINASALDGKGNWNIGKTGYSLTQAFPTNFADMSIVVTTGLVDITQTAADKIWSSATRNLTALGFTLAASDLASGILTAAKFAAGAIDAAALATDAVDEIVDGVWNALLTGATYNIATSAGKRLRQIDAAFEITSGTAVAGSTSTTINLNSADGADVTTDEIYAGDRCVITAGTGIGEHGLIKTYASGTQIATMSKAWVITPSTDSEYVLVPADVDVELWNDNAVTGDGDWAEMQTDLDNVLVDTADMQPKLGSPATDLAADIAAVKAETALIVADTNELQTDDIPGLIAALNDLAAADVLAQVNAALDTVIAELGVGTPATTPTIRTALMLLYMAVSNKRDTIAAQDEIHNAAGTPICDAVVSDDTVVFSKAKYLVP